MNEWWDKNGARTSSLSFNADGTMNWAMFWSGEHLRGTATVNLRNARANRACAGTYQNTWCSNNSYTGAKDGIKFMSDGTINLKTGNEFWAKELP